MCGIAGIFNLDNLPVEQSILRSMINAMSHRGPDADGTFICGDIGLGHKRLAIIDLSDSGIQPMSTVDEKLWIVFNGEIYNYRELRSELQQLGCIFKSETDTEVILWAYRQWGLKCLNRFNGMWSFAIWDTVKKELFCARDRFGVKPFHYYFDGKTFVFASEIKALMRHPSIKRAPNCQVIYDFLIYGRVNHTNETFYKDIKQLPAAHYCLVNREGVKIERHWDVPDLEFSGSIEEAAEEFNRIFEDSIRLRFRSDVEVASCLSGGLDSSSIVCAADRLIKAGEVKTENRLNTFSLAFDFPQFDERKWIGIVKNNADVDNYVVIPAEEDLVRHLSDLIHVQEEPFGSTSIFGQYMVMKLINEHGIKVTLDGQGADEIMAGYLAYADSYFADLYLSGDSDRLNQQVKVYCQKHGLSPEIAADRARRLAETRKFGRFIESNSKYLQKNFAQRYHHEISLPMKFGSFLQNHLHQDLTSTQLPALLRYEDRNSMAFSIESRVPFLDYRLVEFVFSLPAEMKMRDSVTKLILRKAMHGILPPEIENRQDKMGFVTPESVWFRNGLRQTFERLFNSQEIASRGIFDISRIQEEWEDYKVGRRNDSFLIWRIASVELWFRTFIDQEGLWDL